MSSRSARSLRPLTLAFAVLALCGASRKVSAQNLILTNQSVTMGGTYWYDRIELHNSTITVTAYDNGTDKVTKGNLQLVAPYIYIDSTSKIIAKGKGYQPVLCQDGPGPNPTAGGRGGCSVMDSGGGGAHWGRGGRGTKDCPGANCVFPRDWEEACGHKGVGNTCVDDCAWNSDGEPTVAGFAYEHSIWQPEFGAAGGDKGCRDGDGWTNAYCTTATTMIPVAGAGGGRIVLAGVSASGTGELIIEGELNANGKRGCGQSNDSAGGGAGGTILLVGDRVTVRASAIVTAAGGMGGDTQPDATGDCPACSQKSGTCDDCGGGGGGGIISVLSAQVAVYEDLASFNVKGATGGVCTTCTGEAGGGAGELQLSGVYVGEFCDGFDNNFDKPVVPATTSLVDEGLGSSTCGTGACQDTVPTCSATGLPIDCEPIPDPGCQDPLGDTRSRFMVIVDTSGSMLLDLNGAWTFGDGSVNHVGLDTNGDTIAGNDSRLYKAKESLTDVFSAYYPDIDFGLSRYAQGTDLNVNCQLAKWFECSNICCTYDNPANNFGTNFCTVTAGSAGTVTVKAQSPTVDRCINYAGSCGAPRRGADVLVGFDRPVNQLLMWVDHQETQFINDRTEGDHCDFDGGGDCELRGTGPTPLADALYAVNSYLGETIPLDPIGTCRKYGVILLTDGAESCRGNPVLAATELRTQLGIETYVIGFSVLLTEQLSLNQIANAGSFSGTRNAILVSNQDELTTALATIVADSIRYELCNSLDDDCDGLVDEDFAVGQACDDGQLGICRGTGHYVCAASQTAVTCQIDVPGLPPTTEVCNGLDDDCDGEVDEGDVCCNGPEICNAKDDYCGRNPAVQDGDEDPRIFQGGVRVACGSDVGVCQPGLMACVGGVPTCQGGVPPAPEQCDPLDHNCNGVVNDVPPEDCVITNAHGSCPGKRICEAAGAWSACLGQPASPEACNGVDDNCDGHVDEGLEVPISCGVGRCAHTVTFCVGGVEQVCDPMAGALAETCNGIDDDCDGAVDEGLGTTTCGQGICAHTIQNCVNGSSQTCDPLQGSTTETCNGLDDDCDGSVDEGLAPQVCYPPGYGAGTGCTAAGACVGECREGQRTCAGGHFGACTGAVTPAAEICDGKDNDCNGAADDGLGTTTCGVGACQHAQDNCVGGVLQPCDPLQGATPEASHGCDAIDNDCDGAVDEGVSRACYPGGQTGCTYSGGTGTWTCQGECGTGVEGCAGGGVPGWSGTCQGPRLPVAEVCDGKDNDCDGVIDDGVTRQCYGFGSGCVLRADGTGYDCVGACAAGTQACVQGGTGQWGACGGAAGPSVEICDGVDNDCDGQIDEDASGQPLSQACQASNPNGTCTGVQRCGETLPGQWGACTAATPGPEAWADPNVNPGVCDTVDQNCNGVVNDGVPPRTCQVTTALGTCTGTETCTSAGTWVGCTARTPAAEVCDGVDNDCDGQVDEDASGQPLSQACYTGPAGTEGRGQCAAGVRQCTAGGWGPCQGQVLPQPEVCDGVDNDCDGTVDESDAGPPLSRACQNTNASGTCLGLQTCTGNSVDLWTACSAAVPQPEVCDGVDNNCDGVIDGIAEACYEHGAGCTADGQGGWGCQGICWPGIRVCPQLGAPQAGNAFGTCQYQVGPGVEICDGLDNDCDGQVDEAADGSPLAQTCYWPGYGASTGCTAPGECTGACREGVRVCGAVDVGIWGDCLGEVVPTQEVCDGTDNDCDGGVDELSDMPWIGQACPASMGVCNGIWACEDGVQACVGGATQAGRCNGVDDDCDGVVDELDELQADPQYGTTCGVDTGECQRGVFQCVGGAWVCQGEVGPSEEVCDGRDNDCDGGVDVGADCPPVGSEPAYCIDAECRVACDPTDEFPCPGSLTCQPREWEGQTVNVCLPRLGECGGQTCPEGWVCRNDLCVDPCDPDPCQAWQECHGGGCVDVSCTAPGRSCPAGEFCLDHGCVGDPCQGGGGCEAGVEYCVRGCTGTSCAAQCFPVCACPAGQTCDPSTGACVADPCTDAACNVGQRCDPWTGGCEADPCAAVFCPAAEVCFEGACIPDPCALVTCPQFSTCVVRPVGDGPGAVTPLARCEVPDAYWVPGKDGSLILVTGSGCQCGTGGGAGDPVPLLGLLAVLLVLRRRTRPTRRRWVPFAGAALATGAVLILSAPGCRIDPYATGADGHFAYPDGGEQTDGAPVDVAPDACVPAKETCNGRDDDCDGEIDNGFDLQQDPANCGTCGRACDYPHALSRCTDGECVMGACLPGYWDLDGETDSGCEYACFQTNGGVERCDGRDNDCDGEIDEGFDLDTDPLNCGECSNTCVFLHGNGSCEGGQCVLASCRGGYVDLDGEVNNGCECRMGLTEGVVECTEGTQGTCAAGEVCADVDDDGVSHCAPIPLDTCDGRDNDCDGQIDEDALAPLPTPACYTQTSGCVETPAGSGVFDCTGECRAGTYVCQNGEFSCTGQRGPAAESCNGLDDDCNGTADETWNKATDPNNCGSCGHQCAPELPNAIAGCQAGQCVIVGCLPGFWNLDPGAPGCEYACTLSNGGVERCGDGLDNDCNGQTDEGFDLTSDPSNCGGCGHSCEVSKPYGTRVQGGSQACVAGACRFECLPDHYDRNLDLPVLGELSNGCESFCAVSNNGAEVCDGVDNDCDGLVDEGFDLASDVLHCGACGRSCEALKGANTTVIGCTTSVCQYACAPGYRDLNGDLALGSAGNGCECVVSAEVCGDGVDNDCNGQVDEAGAVGCATFYRDADQDGYGDPLDARCLCAADAAARYTAVSAGDCNDANAAVHPGATEVCDGLDNDCDGRVDQDGGGAPLTRGCYTGPVGTQGVGPCRGGTQTCTAGIWSATCAGEVQPQVEACDGVDNDCDGVPNDGFDLLADAANCGSCGYRCEDHTPHAVSACASGACVVVSCLPGYHDLSATEAGCEYACTPQGAGVKVCGSAQDNDCNGTVDQLEFDLQTDPANCGSCGHTCQARRPPGTQVKGGALACVSGACGFECLPGLVDANHDLPTLGEASDGCECVPTNGGVERCDEADNDCDGMVDEGFDLQTDAANCGRCGNACTALGSPAAVHAVSTGCQGGSCRFACQAGYSDLNGDLNSGRPFGPSNDGCEYHCPVWPTTAEICDGVDNDCDGLVDRASGGAPMTRPCYSPGYGPTTGCTAAGSCLGICREGVQTCAGASWGSCVGELVSGSEVCGDGRDNDCDGAVDEGFDLQNDPLNCGSCGTSCLTQTPPNMIIGSPGCVSGQCRYQCLPGFADLDAGTPGCEYVCPRYPPTAEDCNGVDDDCDGVVDEDLPASQNICERRDQVGTPCFGVVATCRDPDGAGPLPQGWYCNYPASVQVDLLSLNRIVAQETRCDGVDNDCDGQVDEAFPDRGQECDNGLLGACRDLGRRICDPGDPSRTVCDLSVLPDADPLAPRPETCNGVDDNCDGEVDNADPLDPERVVDDMVRISHHGLSFWIYQYEASRPDATELGSGRSGARACSRPDVLPWHTVTQGDAAAACAAVGKRLCTAVEWEAACEGAALNDYPYGDLYEPGTCNGVDYDGIPGGDDDDVLLPTGDAAMCLSDDGIYDLSGNLREWTSEQRGSTTGGKAIFVVRGGEYHTPAPGLTCQFDLSRQVHDVVLPTVGFRCCSDLAP